MLFTLAGPMPNLDDLQKTWEIASMAQDKSRTSQPFRPSLWSSLDDRWLTRKINQLKQLCDEVDPWAPLPPLQQEQLKKFGITSMDDPFQLTNQLLLLLEDALEEKLRREQLK